MKVPELNATLAKAICVAGITGLLTFLGCSLTLAHLETSTSAEKKTVVSDEQFAKKAAQGGMAEVKMGQLAQEKGSSDAVKQFGRRMVTDHTKAGQELKEAAAKENITLPTELDAKDQATYDKLSKLSGTAFDKEYARDMVKDHQEDVSEFASESNGGQREAIKAFATETLPTLKDHLKEAREMRQSVGGSSNNNAPPKRATKMHSDR
jgi:putative membrane protein